VTRLQIPVLGVVPVTHDDREAPSGCAAARLLGDAPLLRRAVSALARSGVIDRVLVPVPPALAAQVGDLVAGLPGPATVEVLAVHDNGPGIRLLAALLAHPPADDGVVVVHDPLHPLAPPSLVVSVVEMLLKQGAGCAGVLPIRPVTDTLKAVDEDDVVTATADREAYRMVYSPQAYRARPLLAALLAAGPGVLRERGADRLPRLVQDAGGRLFTVPAPGEVFRIATADDLILAEAMLHVGMQDEARPARH
jgi:2-C-methyl-D-erythritol 4-phosphate cytidylyltransferase